jgi:hypothetical protein
MFFPTTKFISSMTVEQCQQVEILNSLGWGIITGSWCILSLLQSKSDILFLHSCEIYISNILRFS